MENIVIKPCRYCQATGDYRGRYGMKFADFKSEKNKCLHCNGTGNETEVFTNVCKYCGAPCHGYCCEDCFNIFENEYSE